MQGTQIPRKLTHAVEYSKMQGTLGERTSERACMKRMGLPRANYRKLCKELSRNPSGTTLANAC